MKHLVIASDSFLPRWDGVARFLSEIIPELSEYKITVIAPDYQGKPPLIENVQIVRIPLSTKLQFGDITFPVFNYKKVKKLIATADIVWTHTIGPIGIATVHAARKLKIPVISYVHSLEWELASNSVGRFRGLTYVLVRLLARYLYNKFDLIIVPTREVARILQFNRIHRPKMVVYLGVKADKFIPTLDKAVAKQHIGIDPQKLLVGATGRIAREKDLQTLVRAFLQVRDIYKAQLIIVGEGPEDQKTALSKKGVILTGAKNNVVPYLQAMDVYVLPSLTETSSLSTMEAMSCGIPVVATKVGFVKHYVKDMENGVLIPKRDAAALQEKLDVLLQDKELRERLGREARQTIMEKHQWKTTVERIKTILGGF